MRPRMQVQARRRMDAKRRLHPKHDTYEMVGKPVQLAFGRKAVERLGKLGLLDHRRQKRGMQVPVAPETIIGARFRELDDPSLHADLQGAG